MIVVVGRAVNVERLGAYSLPHHLLSGSGVTMTGIGRRHREGGVHGALSNRWSSVERRLNKVDIWSIMRYTRRLRPTIEVRDLHFDILCVRAHSLFSELVEVLLTFELLFEAAFLLIKGFDYAFLDDL